MSVLCVGQIVADVVVRPVRGIPAPGTADTVDDIEFVAGGCAANTACVIAKLGLPVHFVGQVGCDAFGDMVAGDLTDAGVDIGGLVRDALTATASVIVLVDPSGERSFLYREGGNEQLTASLVHVPRFPDATVMHIGGAMKLYSLDLGVVVTQAKAHGLTTVLDTDWEPRNLWRQRLDGALPHIDYILTNEKEGAKIAGQPDPEAIGRTLLCRGAKAAVIKLGPLGSLLVTPERISHFDTYDVGVVDTTCAGDSFAAGFVYGLHEGWDLDRTMRFASAAGALATTTVSHVAIRSIGDVERVVDGAGVAQRV